MEFIHTSYIPGETIAALATPPGVGGIAIVRISGKEALKVAQPLFSKSFEGVVSHTAQFGEIRSLTGEVLDRGLALVMRAPRTFTGEETVEFHCHGGPIIVKKILEALQCAGARLARPGEFSFQAYMNGKIDLTQAEAIQNMISAKAEGAYKAAKEHLAGKLQQKIVQFQKKLFQITAILEAWVDFPDEGLEFATPEQIDESLLQLIRDMEELGSTFEEGKKLQDGLRIIILGPPNAGKSSLLNALLRRERAIVTDIAGTTRDSLEEQMQLDGFQLSLVDTAGIRETNDVIEKEGIKRAWEHAQEADLILLVIDAMFPQALNQFLHLPQKRVVLIWNKVDLLSPQSASKLPKFGKIALAISAKNEMGLEALKAELKAFSEGTLVRDVVLTSLRHHDALERAIASIKNIRLGLTSHFSPEFLTHDAREGLKALGEIIGTNVTEEILSSIFSTFCVGK